jgi:hypothetical protein
MSNSAHLVLQRPKYLRPFGKIYQAINADTLRAQNMETWPYFNQVIFTRICSSVPSLSRAFFLSFCNSFLCIEAKSYHLETIDCTAFLWHVAEIFLVCNDQGILADNISGGNQPLRANYGNFNLSHTMLIQRSV